MQPGQVPGMSWTLHRRARMKVGRIALTIVIAAALPVCADEMARITSGGISVVYPKAMDDGAQMVVQIYHKARESFRLDLGLAPDEPVLVRMFASEAEFKAFTGGRSKPETLGLAYPSRNLIVVNCSRFDRSGYNNLRITVRHELCHLVVGAIERSGGQKVPYWFNEGLAVYTSGRLPLAGQGLLSAYVSRDTALPLSSIESSFPTQSAALQVAYEQSVDIVRFIVSEHSPRAISEICTKMAGGQSFEEALVSVTGLTPEQLEQEWLESMGMTNSAVAFVLRHLNVFSILSLLVIIAFARYMLHRRRAMARWEREENVFPRDV